MEEETIALDHCCQDIFPIVDITQLMVKSVGLPVRVSLMKVYIQEDNSGPLILARTLPQKYTPHSKYYETNTIWFHEDINKRKIVLLKIETVEQLGDLFTKVLPRYSFE